MLDDILLQDVVGHAKRLVLWIEMFLIQVVTVVTPQVAEGTSRFDKNLKLAGSFGHSAKESTILERIIGEVVLSETIGTLRFNISYLFV